MKNLNINKILIGAALFIVVPAMSSESDNNKSATHIKIKHARSSHRSNKKESDETKQTRREVVQELLLREKPARDVSLKQAKKNKKASELTQNKATQLPVADSMQATSSNAENRTDVHHQTGLGRQQENNCIRFNINNAWIFALQALLKDQPLRPFEICIEYDE